MRALDLTGQRFGNLVANYKTNHKIRGNIAWHCKCDCGNEIEVIGADLKRLHTTSCGCKKIKYNEDLTLKKINRFTVLYKINGSSWHCICECGTEKDVTTYDLLNNKIKSCGCLQKEIASKIGQKTGAENWIYHYKDLTNQKFDKLTAIKIISHKPLKWLCKCDCGNFTKVNSQDLISGNTSSCGCLKESKGELRISELLKNNNIPFEREKTFNNCKYKKSNYCARFDFYVNNSYIIEYDGAQHFKEIKYFSNCSLKENQDRDEFKNNWCKENNIPIIRIPYTRLQDLQVEDLLLETSKFIINK